MKFIADAVISVDTFRARRWQIVCAERIWSCHYKMIFQAGGNGLKKNMFDLPVGGFTRVSIYSCNTMARHSSGYAEFSSLYDNLMMEGDFSFIIFLKKYTGRPANDRGLNDIYS